MHENSNNRGEPVSHVSSRASFSASPLARPSKPIYMLASRIQDYIYFPSPDPLYVVLGSIAANMMKGAPVWLVLVGAPSSGRTILLETLADVPRIHIVGAIKSPAALLSGTSKKDRAKDATGGLLRRIGPRGAMVMKDFTSTLSLPKEAMGEVISALREIFDGRYSRPIGGEGGQMLQWFGRIGFIAACTTAIDRHQAAIGDLGERWIYYRYEQTDGYGETIKALGIRDPEAMMLELRQLVSFFLENIELEWDQERRELSSEEKNRLYAMAAFVVAARSSVPRDRFQGNEVADVVSREGPPRIATELGQLYLGLERIGLDEDERWRIIGKIALDSIRQMRAMLLMALRTKEPKGSVMTLDDVRELIKVGPRPLAMLIEDLMIHGLIEKIGKTENRLGGEEGATGGFRLTNWSVKQMNLGWQDHLVSKWDAKWRKELEDEG